MYIRSEEHKNLIRGTKLASGKNVDVVCCGGAMHCTRIDFPGDRDWRNASHRHNRISSLFSERS